MTRRTDPFADIEDLLDTLTGGGGVAAGGIPPVDVADADDEFVVVVDLPGYDAESLDVTLTDPTTLYVAAEREHEAVTEADRYVTREREQVSVSRRIGLPEPVDESGTAATYEEGILTVRLPKRSSAPDDGTDIPVE
mgnify:CR=1 FL=1